MRGRRFFTLALGCALSGCAQTPVTPTSPASAITSPSGARSVGATPILAVRVDSRGSTVAITAVSQVVFDATGTPGDKLRYAVQFGDGQSATTAVSSHVYASAGTYTATLTVTDAAGQQTSTTATVVVKAVQGTWVQTGLNERTHGFEVRRVAIDSQTGPEVRGRAFELGAVDRIFTGRLGSDRTLHITLDDGAGFDGVIPDGVYAEGAVFPLTARGGTADGQTLVFTAVEGNPASPPPDAVLRMRFFSFSAPFAVQGFSPILFDGTASRGDGLTQFIEFGDTEFAVDASAVHPIKNAGHYTARLTVADRFGRVDSETMDFDVVSFVPRNPIFFQGYGSGVLPEVDRLDIESQNGAEFTGRYVSRTGAPPFVTYKTLPFTGVLSGDRDIRFVLSGSNVVLTGTLELSLCDGLKGELMLTQSGGAADGKLLYYVFRSSYC